MQFQHGYKVVAHTIPTTIPQAGVYSRWRQEVGVRNIGGERSVRFRVVACGRLPFVQGAGRGLECLLVVDYGLFG
jgi:hypothetical protein